MLLRFILLLGAIFLGSCRNAVYELIKPRAEPTNEPTPTVTPTPAPAPAPTDTPAIIPTPTATPTSPVAPINPTGPIDPNVPVLIPNPNPNGPFPPLMPGCPTNPCMVRDTEIVLAIDTSTSMANKQTMIQNNIAAMVDYFRPFPNVRFSYVGDDSFCGEPSINFYFIRGIRRYTSCINSHNAIARVNEVLSTGNFLPTASIEVIIISDDNGLGPNNLAIDFAPRFLSSVRVSSVVGVGDIVQVTPQTFTSAAQSLSLCFFPNFGTTNIICTWDAIGFEHMRLSQMTSAGIYSICNPNWSPLFLDLFNRMVQ